MTNVLQWGRFAMGSSSVTEKFVLCLAGNSCHIIGWIGWIFYINRNHGKNVMRSYFRPHNRIIINARSIDRDTDIARY